MRHALRRLPEWALPAGIFAAAALFHWLQGRWIRVPFVWPDELAAADGARSAVEGGRGGWQTLYSFVTAPVWTGGVGTGYALAKVLGAIFVALTAFPAYALARLVAPRGWAAAAAVVAVVAPPSLYASTVRPVSLAYPLATAGGYWLVRFLAERKVRYGLASLVVLGLAAGCWPALLYLVLAAAVVTATSLVPPRTWLAWPGASLPLVLVSGGYGLFFVARASSSSFAAGAHSAASIPGAAAASLAALGLGLGLMPAAAGIAGAATAWRRPAPWPQLAALTLASVLFLSLGSAVEALGHGGGGRSADDAVLLAAVPLLAAAAAGAAGWIRIPALTITGVALVLLGLVPRGGAAKTFQAHAPSFGLDRLLRVAPVDLGLILVFAAAVVGASLLLSLGRRRGLPRVAPAVAAFALVALVAGEIEAGHTARHEAAAAAALLPRPASAPTEAAGAAAFGVLPSAETGPEALDGLLFFNPKAVALEPSLEGRTVDPGTGQLDPPLTPNGLVFELGSRRLAGTALLAAGAGTLLRLGSPPQLAETVEGLYPDGWSGAHAVYRRFDSPSAGAVDVTVSRAGWGGPEVPGAVTLSLGPVGGTVQPVDRLDIHPGQTVERRIRTPAQPFQLVVDSQTFSPSSFGQGDTRQLGVQLKFRYGS